MEPVFEEHLGSVTLIPWHRLSGEVMAISGKQYAALSEKSGPAPIGYLPMGVLMMWLSRSRIAPAGGVRPPTQMA
jgi:hypothetical protein